MSDPTKLAYGEVFSVDNLMLIWEAITKNWVVKGLCALLFCVNDWFFSPRYDLIIAVYSLVALDTLTGLLKAYKNHTISSSGFFRFALKVIVYMSMLAMGGILDRISAISDLISGLSVVATFLAITESISILENSASLGFEVPGKLLKFLKFSQEVSTVKPEDKKSKEV